MKIIMDLLNYIKANRKGSRDAQLEQEAGWVAVRKVHKSKKNYNRKLKHKKDE
jgi:hypothetical protein